jgi:flavin reductase (DIM6/NTAB) family NADH-FMN oxidoreductase RutF
MLVVSGTGDNANIMTVVWGSIVSGNPPTIGIAVNKHRYSLELIRENREFTVNIPSKDLVAEADYCGLASGSKTNKFLDTGLTAIDGSIVKTPLIKECPYNIECKVIQEVEVGDWILVLGEIVEAHIDEDKLVKSDRIIPDYAKIQPPSYFGNAREYRGIGEICGDAFSIGKSLRN